MVGQGCKNRRAARRSHLQWSKAEETAEENAAFLPEQLPQSLSGAADVAASVGEASSRASWTGSAGSSASYKQRSRASTADLVTVFEVPIAADICAPEAAEEEREPWECNERQRNESDWMANGTMPLHLDVEDLPGFGNAEDIMGPTLSIATASSSFSLWHGFSMPVRGGAYDFQNTQAQAVNLGRRFSAPDIKATCNNFMARGRAKTSAGFGPSFEQMQEKRMEEVRREHAKSFCLPPCSEMTEGSLEAWRRERATSFALPSSAEMAEGTLEAKGFRGLPLQSLFGPPPEQQGAGLAHQSMGQYAGMQGHLGGQPLSGHPGMSGSPMFMTTSPPGMAGVPGGMPGLAQPGSAGQHLPQSLMPGQVPAALPSQPMSHGGGVPSMPGQLQWHPGGLPGAPVSTSVLPGGPPLQGMQGMPGHPCVMTGSNVSNTNFASFPGRGGECHGNCGYYVLPMFDHSTPMADSATSSWL